MPAYSSPMGNPRPQDASGQQLPNLLGNVAPIGGGQVSGGQDPSSGAVPTTNSQTGAPGAVNFGANAYNQVQQNNAAIQAGQQQIASAGNNLGALVAGASQLGTAQANQAQAGTQYGGYVNGANDFADYAEGLGAGYASMPGGGIVNPNAGADRSAVQGAIASAGNVPKIAEAQFGQSLGQSIAAGQAAANSARGGGAAIAGAQQAGMAQQAATAANGAQQAGMMQGALGMQAAQAQLGGYQALQNLDAQAGVQQAQLNQQQQQMGIQGQLGALGLANQAETAQMNAGTNVYATNTGANEAANALNAGQRNSIISGGSAVAGAGLAAMAMA